MQDDMEGEPSNRLTVVNEKGESELRESISAALGNGIRAAAR